MSLHSLQSKVRNTEAGWKKRQVKFPLDLLNSLPLASLSCQHRTPNPGSNLAEFPVLSIKLQRLKQLWAVFSKITLTQTRSFVRTAFLQSQPEGIKSTLLTQYESCKEENKACHFFLSRPAKRNNLPSNITSFFGIWSEMEYKRAFCFMGFVYEKFEQLFLLLRSQGGAKCISTGGEEGSNLGALHCLAMAHHLTLKAVQCSWGRSASLCVLCSVDTLSICL